MKKLILVVPLLIAFLVAAVVLLLLLGLWIWAAVVFLFTFILNWWSESFALHLFKRESEDYDFRVLTFNVNRAHEISVNRGTTDELIDFILEQKADIVLLQEYNADLYPQVQEKLSQVYPYGSGKDSNSRFKSVFCKFPIESCEQLMVDADDLQYELFWNAIYCKKNHDGMEVMPICKIKVKIGEKVVQLFNCHLMSNNYSVVIRNLRKKGKTLVHGFWPIWRRIDFGFKARELQAQIISKNIEPGLPTIICGDFNEVSGAPSLRILQKCCFTDAWWKEGFGFGFTFHGMRLRLRLDHILYLPQKLELKKIDIPHSEVSDHYPVVCDFSMRT